jgi:hypothetical protein
MLHCEHEFLCLMVPGLSSLHSCYKLLVRNHTNVPIKDTLPFSEIKRSAPGGT